MASALYRVKLVTPYQHDYDDDNQNTLEDIWVLALPVDRLRRILRLQVHALGLSSRFAMCIHRAAGGESCDTGRLLRSQMASARELRNVR